MDGDLVEVVWGKKQNLTDQENVTNNQFIQKVFLLTPM